MPISKTANVITYTAPKDLDRQIATDVHRSDAFAVCDNNDVTKQISLDASGQATGTAVSIKSDPTNTGAFTLPPFTSAVLAAVNLKTQTSIPVTASIVTLSAATQVYIAIPAGTLTTLTVVLPAAPADGYNIRVVSTQAVTNLVVSASGSDSVVGMPTAAVANTPFGVVYLASGTTWYRI